MRALSSLAACLLGGFLLSGVVWLVWHISAAAFVTAVLFIGVMSWVALRAQTRR